MRYAALNASAVPSVEVNLTGWKYTCVLSHTDIDRVSKRMLLHLSCYLQDYAQTTTTIFEEGYCRTLDQAVKIWSRSIERGGFFLFFPLQKRALLRTITVNIIKTIREHWPPLRPIVQSSPQSTILNTMEAKRWNSTINCTKILCFNRCCCGVVWTFMKKKNW